MSTLYVLQLQNGKYYVGKTDDINRRYAEHKAGKGSEWTKLHKPVKILETRQITSTYDETNITKDLMKKHGFQNVRGGAYCQTELPDYVEETIKHELRSNDDRCFKCGKSGHFANQCKRKSSFKAVCECGEDFLDVDEFITHMKGCKTRNKQTNISKKQSYTPKQTGNCYRCGRSGHWASSCYARTHVDGEELDSDDSEYESE